MNRRAGQGKDFDDLGKVGQLVDVDGAIRDARASQFADQFWQLIPTAHEDRHVVLRMRCQGFGDDATTDTRLLGLVATKDRMHMAGSDPGLVRNRYRFRVDHCAARRVVALGKHLGEDGIEPFHEPFARAEIAAQHQRFQANLTDTVIARKQELPDFRIAKTVDRLHRVTDAIQSAAVAGFPTSGQCFEHAVLRARRVLHFVDQEVLDLVIEQQRNVTGTFCRTERFAGSQCNIDVIGDTLCGEKSLQFNAGQWQQAE